MNKNVVLQNIILIIIVVGIVIFPLMFVNNSEFSGTDDAASDLIAEMDDDFEPWFEPLISLPGEETEGLLFALQAALGSGVIFYIIGYLKGKCGQNNLEKPKKA